MKQPFGIVARQIGDGIARKIDFDIQYMAKALNWSRRYSHNKFFQKWIDEQKREFVSSLRPRWLPERIWHWLITRNQ